MLAWRYPHALGEAYKVGNAANAQLRHHSHTVHLNSFFNRPNCRRNLLIKPTGNNIGQHFPFPSRQRGQPTVYQAFFFVPKAVFFIDFAGFLCGELVARAMLGEPHPLLATFDPVRLL